MRRMGQMFHLEAVDMDSESITIKRNDFERLEHLITKTIDQRLTEIDQRLTEAIDKKPRFDWKWFLGLTVPIVSAILAAAVIGYFGIRADLIGIRADLRVMQSQFGEMQKDIVQIRQTLNEHTRAISNLQGDIKTLEGDIKVIKYALKIKQ